MLTARMALVEVRTGRASAVSLLQRCLQAIDAKEDKIRAWECVDRAGAIAQAEALDSELLGGRVRRPLHGVTVGVKDLLDVKGMVTTAGSDLLRGSAPASADSVLVAKLRASGCVILGKTVTTPFAFYDPPPTRNPLDLERTPGGSSSGSAAAVAAQMCMVAIGTQTFGSVTRPSTFCGLASLKPTWSLLPMAGSVPVAPSLDTLGLMAPCVDDLWVLFSALGQHGVGAMEEIDELPVSETAPRIGVPTSYFGEGLSDDVTQAMQTARHALQENGATLVDVDLPPSFEQLHTMARHIMVREMIPYHQALQQAHPDTYPEGIRQMLEEGLALQPSEYDEALAHQRQYRADLKQAMAAAQVDCIVTPAAKSIAPLLSENYTGDPSFNVPWTYAGVPTISVPFRAANQPMPYGLQLAGLWGREEELFSVAGWCEEAVRTISS